jgi:hypothetical protein
MSSRGGSRSWRICGPSRSPANRQATTSTTSERPAHDTVALASEEVGERAVVSIPGYRDVVAGDGLPDEGNHFRACVGSETTLAQGQVGELYGLHAKAAP